MTTTMDKVLKAAVRSLSSTTHSEGEDVNESETLEEILRSLDDDSSAQARLKAEENLNKYIFVYSRSARNPRVLIELYKEIKRNGGGPRALKAALGALPHFNIRPQKGKAYLENVIPCLLNILETRFMEEQVLSALADTFHPLFRAFGSYATSSETEKVLRALIKVLFSQESTPSTRRSVSICLSAVASQNNRPSYYIPWTFCLLIEDFLIERYASPEIKDKSALLGLFAAARTFIPLIFEIGEVQQQLVPDLDNKLLTLYELCIVRIERDNDPSTLSATLELLLQILKTPPKSLKTRLLSTQGITKQYLSKNALSDSVLQEPNCIVNDSSTHDEGTHIFKEPLSSLSTDADKYSEEVIDEEPLSSQGNLGSYGDKDIPLVYAGRLLAAKTLLTPEKGKPRTDVRVSIRSVGISCIAAIVALSPKIFLLTLYVDQYEDDFDNTPLLRDIASKDNFILHEDPQISGATATLLGNVMRGCLIETGGVGLEFWFNQRRPDYEDIINIFEDLLTSPSVPAIVVKFALSSIKSFLNLMLSSSLARRARSLLLIVIDDKNLLWKNSYWLVRTELVDTLSTIEFKRVHYLDGGIACGYDVQEKFLEIMKLLLGDEDVRVRTFTADALIKSVPNLYFSNDWIDECTESSSRESFSSLEWSVLRLADWLREMICVSTNQHLTIGALDAYFKLRKSYDSSKIDNSIIDILSNFLRSSSSFTLDVGNHTLALNLLSIIITKEESKSKTDVMRHCIRLLNMMNLLIEESLHPVSHENQGAPLNASNSGSNSGTRKDEDNGESKLGSFSRSAHYSKLYESLKNVYASYVLSPISVQNDPNTKFLALLQTCLKTIQVLLDRNCGLDCNLTYTAEILGYLSVTIHIEPLNSFMCVQSLLSSVLATPNEEKNEDVDDCEEDSICLSDHTFYKLGFCIPYQKFILKYRLSKDSSSCSSMFDDKLNSRLSSGSSVTSSLFKETLYHKTCDRSTLMSYIRLFEPIVIKALQLYTVSSKVPEQKQVLNLLTQLVRLCVNYCRLDSDKVFFGYVRKHLDYICSGQIPEAEVLIPKIFHFLVLLSVEKFHSKVIIGIDEIVDLLRKLLDCDNPKLIIQALIPVAKDLFRTRENQNQSDLEAHRETVLQFLIRFMNYPQVLRVLIFILGYVKSEGKDKWRKLSRRLFDNILSLLSTQNIQLDDMESLDTLYLFFLSLAPVTLRPVDALLSTVLTSSVDLSSMQDVQRWLGFVIISLCVVSNQSPEEGILSRLEEFGITPIGQQNNGLTETTDLSKPESTFAKFIFQVVGASLSKLHQSVYSLDEHKSFLEKEVSLLLNFVIYVLKSGNYCRVARSAQNIAEENDGQNLLYTLDFINDIALELSHAYPFITLRWVWILSLTRRVSLSLWSRLTSFKTILIPSLDKEILRRGSLIFLCGHLHEHNNASDNSVELVTWLVSNFVDVIIENMDEEPVSNFVQTVHLKAPSSGLFLQAVISKCQHRLSSIAFQKNALRALESVHDSHSASLLTFLIQRLSPKAHLSLSARVQRLCCKRVEGILSGGAPRELLTPEELSNAMGLLRRRKSSQRYSRLIVLLNKLCCDYYLDLVSPLECDEGRTFTPGSLSGTVPNKEWFISQLKVKCSKDRYYTNVSKDGDAEQCAKMLAWLESEEEIAGIVMSSDFNLSVLEWVFKNPESPQLLLQTSRKLFFEHSLKKLVEENLPEEILVYGPSDWTASPAESRYKDIIDMNFSSEAFRDNLIKSLSVSSSIPVEILSHETDTPYLLRVSFLSSLEYCKWLRFYCTEDYVGGREEHRQVAFAALSYVARDPHIIKKMNTEDGGKAVHALYSVLLGDEDIKASRAPTCMRYEELIKSDEKNEIILAALKINRLFSLFLNRDFNERQVSLPSYLITYAKDVVLGLARLPAFASYVSVPLETWRIGWKDGTPFGKEETEFPLISLDHLQEIDVLREYSSRCNALGWTSKQQFDETWMSLLGICRIAREDLGESEFHCLSHCSALVISTATNLLLQTLDLPHPGLKNTSSPLTDPRDVPCPFLSTPRGMALNKLQIKIRDLLRGTCVRTLPVNSSINLEKMGEESESIYGLGQVSVDYILTGIAYYEGRMEVEENERRSHRKMPLKFCLREDTLVNTGLDLRSCLHFLFELYLQWFRNPSDTPLILLTEAVRSVIALSDIFMEVQSFEWMYRCFSDIMKIHPPEDEILTSLLRLGICKAVAIIGPSRLLFMDGENGASEDRIKKMVEMGYKSPFMPARLSSIQGVLYLLQRRSEDSEQFLNSLARISIEYLNANLPYLPHPGCDSLAAHAWSLTFYLLENYESALIDSPWYFNAIQLALSTTGKTNTSRGLYLLLLSGLERLVLSGKLTKTYPGSGIRALDQVIKLATDLLTEFNPVLVLPSIQLFLACMYGGKSFMFLKNDDEEKAKSSERLMHTMEQMSILFDCVRRSGPEEARFLCQILPQVLIDFCSASDFINRVINEFIHPGQPHQTLLAGVMFSVFRQASHEHSHKLQEWVLETLSNFTKRSPISHSAWCLSCFFLSVPPPRHTVIRSSQEEYSSPYDYWLQALFPHLQTRLGSFTSEDKKLFCLAAKEFYSNLPSDKEKNKFLSTFREVALPKTPYYDLLQVL